MKENWEIIKDPLNFVIESKGLITLEPEGTNPTYATVEKTWYLVFEN